MEGAEVKILSVSLGVTGTRDWDQGDRQDVTVRVKDAAEVETGRQDVQDQRRDLSMP